MIQRVLLLLPDSYLCFKEVWTRDIEDVTDVYLLTSSLMVCISRRRWGTRVRSKAMVKDKSR